MRSLMASKNSYCAFQFGTGLRRLSQGIALIILVTIGFAVPSNAAEAQEEGPKIDPFLCTYNELDPGTGLYQFTIYGALTNTTVLEGQTIRITGGPFTATTTTDQTGGFAISYVM